MRKILLIFGLCLLTTISLDAQNRGGRNGDYDRDHRYDHRDDRDYRRDRQRDYRRDRQRDFRRNDRRRGMYSHHRQVRRYRRPARVPYYRPVRSYCNTMMPYYRPVVVRPMVRCNPYLW